MAHILLKEKNSKFFIMCTDSYLVYCVATCRGYNYIMLGVWMGFLGKY